MRVVDNYRFNADIIKEEPESYFIDIKFLREKLDRIILRESIAVEFLTCFDEIKDVIDADAHAIILYSQIKEFNNNELLLHIFILLSKIT